MLGWPRNKLTQSHKSLAEARIEWVEATSTGDTTSPTKVKPMWALTLMPRSSKRCLTTRMLQPKKLRTDLVHLYLISQSHQDRRMWSPEVPMNWTTVQLTMGSGPRRGFVKAKVSNSGKTVASTKATGRMIRLMDMEDSSMPMVTVTSGNGSMTKHMEDALTNTWTALIMLETGKKINSTDTA